MRDKNVVDLLLWALPAIACLRHCVEESVTPTKKWEYFAKRNWLRTDGDRQTRTLSRLWSDIERRFARSLASLLTVFSPVVDACRCFMNSGVTPELVFEQQGEQRISAHAWHYQLLLEEFES